MILQSPHPEISGHGARPPRRYFASMWTFLASVADAVTVSELAPLVGHAESRTRVRVSFDPSGVRLVSWADDGVRVWSPDDGELIHHIAGWPSQLVVGDRGRTALAGYKNQALLLDLDTGRHLRSFAAGWDWVDDLAADPQDRWAVIGDDSEQRCCATTCAPASDSRCPRR